MRSLLAVGVLCACGALPIACAALLGDDFEIVDTGGQGASGSGGPGSGAGGGGGAGGGAGAAPAPYYDCVWDLPEHRLVTSHEANPMWSFTSLFAARRGPDSVRAVAMRPTGLEDFLDIWTLDSSANIGFSAWPALEVHAVERVSSSEIGILYTNPMGPELHILVVDDGSPDGLDGTSVALATPATLPGFNNTNFQLNAQMAAVPDGGLDDWLLDVVVGYQNGTGEHVLYYGRYDGLVMPTFTRISSTSTPLNADDIEPQGMLQFGGTSYAYFGDSGASLGQSVWVVGPNVTGVVTPTQIAQEEGFLGMVGFTDYANVAMFSTANGIRFLTGALGGADYGSFTPADLLVAAEFASQLDLPVFEAGGGWCEDIFTMIGPDADRSLDMAYYFLDNEGRERAQGPLDFTLMLPAEENRRDLGHFATALRGDPLAEDGGTVHVVWTEGHDRNSQPFDVLYYDRLRCTPE